MHSKATMNTCALHAEEAPIGYTGPHSPTIFLHHVDRCSAIKASLRVPCYGAICDKQCSSNCLMWCSWFICMHTWFASSFSTSVAKNPRSSVESAGKVSSGSDGLDGYGVPRWVIIGVSSLNEFTAGFNWLQHHFA